MFDVDLAARILKSMKTGSLNSQKHIENLQDKSGASPTITYMHTMVLPKQSGNSLRDF
jgi:hypothetical protein